MKTVKVSDLSGAALDWAVATCECAFPINLVDTGSLYYYSAPSTDWSQGGPIIDREKIGFRPPRATKAPNGSQISRIEDGWFATTYTWYEDGDCMPNVSKYGQTALIAAMRCYVASKLGETVEIPDEL